MAVIIRWITWSCITLLSVHALAFGLMVLLPDAASVALGIFAADETVLSAVKQSYQTRTYIETVLALLKGDWGKTLDGLHVFDSLLSAARDSAPRISAALACMSAAALGGVIWSRGGGGVVRLAELISAMPPFFVAFVCYAVLASTQALLGSSVASWFQEILVITALAAPGAALVYVQSSNALKQALSQPFALTSLSAGANPMQLRLSMTPNVVVQLVPTIEKAVVLLLASTSFTEPVLGVSGIGSSTIRAMTRGDVNSILAIVVAFCAFVLVTRLVATVSRSAFRLEGQ